jgi:hypothetical protein
MKKILLPFCLFILVFQTQAQSYQGLIISEIFYMDPARISNDSLEFIELCNSTANPMDITGVQVTKAIGTYTFPSYILQPHSYIVIAKNPTRFASVFGFTPDAWVSGSLSNSGEAILIKDPSSNIIDSVYYGVTANWPQAARGGGASMVFCNPAGNQNDSLQWTASITAVANTFHNMPVFASPGQQDAACTLSVGTVTNNGNIQLSPNPAQELIRLSLDIHVVNGTTYSIYNTAGQIILSGTMESGMQEISLNGIDAGLYIVKVISSGSIYTTKLVIAK